jgi:hypothetical protein
MVSLFIPAGIPVSRAGPTKVLRQVTDTMFAGRDYASDDSTGASDSPLSPGPAFPLIVVRASSINATLAVRMAKMSGFRWIRSTRAKRP